MEGRECTWLIVLYGVIRSGINGTDYCIVIIMIKCLASLNFQHFKCVNNGASTTCTCIHLLQWLLGGFSGGILMASGNLLPNYFCGGFFNYSPMPL